MVWSSQHYFILPSSTPWCQPTAKQSKTFFSPPHGINRDIFFCIYRGARAEANIQNIKAEFKVTGIFPINSRLVLGQLSKPTAKAAANPGLIPLEYLKTPLGPSTAFGRKLSSLSNWLNQLLKGRYAAGYYALLMLLSTPLPKPILLVQSYSTRSKIFDL